MLSHIVRAESGPEGETPGSGVPTDGDRVRSSGTPTQRLSREKGGHSPGCHRYTRVPNRVDRDLRLCASRSSCHTPKAQADKHTLMVECKTTILRTMRRIRRICEDSDRKSTRLNSSH